MCCSLSLQDMPDLYALMVQIWVWNLQLPPVLYFAPLPGASN